MRIKLSGSKQLPNIFKGCGSMIYVGIDIAKQKHFAAATTADGEVLIPPFGFYNDAEDSNSSFRRLSPSKKKIL